MPTASHNQIVSKARRINTATLLLILMSIDKPMKVQLRTITQPALSGKAKVAMGLPPFDAVFKESRMTASIGESYMSKVNKALARSRKEADFIPAKRTWGEHVSKCVIAKDGVHYLNVMNPEALFPRYLTASGAEIPASRVTPHLPVRSTSKAQTDAGLKPEKQQVLVTYKLASIAEIVIPSGIWKGHYVTGS